MGSGQIECWPDRLFLTPPAHQCPYGHTTSHHTYTCGTVYDVGCFTTPSGAAGDSSTGAGVGRQMDGAAVLLCSSFSSHAALVVWRHYSRGLRNVGSHLPPCVHGHRLAARQRKTGYPWSHQRLHHLPSPVPAHGHLRLSVARADPSCLLPLGGVGGRLQSDDGPHLTSIARRYRLSTRRGW